MREWIGSAVKIISENAVLDYIWGLCLSVSAVILFLLLIRPFMKRLPRIGMYLLWLFMVVRMVCPFSVSGIYEFLPDSAGETAAQIGQSVRPECISRRIIGQQGDEKYGGMQNAYRLKPGFAAHKNKSPAGGTRDKKILSEAVSEKSPDNGTAGSLQKTPQEISDTAQKDSSIVTAGTVIFMIWLIGVLCCILYLVCSLRMNRKMFRHAVHLFDNVYEHPYVCSSFVGGILSPKIYVPKGMEKVDMECILIHERIHIRRQDYRVKPLVFFVFSFLWFNPLVWVGYRLMMRDMEVSCDEAVVRKLGDAAKKRYSYLLLAMASGENDILCPNTAFGAGAVNERIHGVMRYKKPTKFMMAAVILAVAVCGCGISSVPEETAKPSVKAEKEAVYVEQTIPEVKIDIEGDKDVVCGFSSDSTVDPEGRIAKFGTVFETGEGDKRSIQSWVKAELVDGHWQRSEIGWEKECEKLLKGKKTELADGFYGPDGLLYLVIYELPAKYYENEYDEKNLYLIGQYLFRVDEKTGEVTDLEVPSEDWDKVFPDDPEGGKGLAYNSYVVFADGNYLVYNYGGISALYSGSTGEKLTEIQVPDSTLSPITAGDDFLCWAEVNQSSGEVEAKVCDENGKNAYTLSTGMPYKEGELPGIALGAKGNTIMMATGKGIAETQYGDDKFTTIASSEADNLYYLSGDGYKALDILKGEAEDYFVSLIKGEDDEVFCHYTKQG